MEILKSPRLILRPLIPNDAVHFARLLGPDQSGVRMTATIPDPCTEEAAREWIVQNTSQETGHIFAITHAQSGEFMGAIGFGDSPGNGDLGYWIGKPFRGKGYATEAIRRIVTHASHLGIRRLFAETFLTNPASSRVLIKNGFRLAGKGTRNIPARGGSRAVLKYVVEIQGCSGQNNWK
ncbi:MAG TPA: GNAT family N-acetyltransferase [Deltaproteobacteria bacterium]|nr:GNAT family N-acetyltransferase [Deltaproteobacteria bacterium]